MKQYLELCQKILDEGQVKEDRTGTGTISIFGHQMRFNLQDGFPMMTTKRLYHRAVVHELLWFISGSTNITYLVRNNVKIWNEWAFERYKKSSDYKNETMDEYLEKIKSDDDFAQIHGELGPVYGKQWRNFNGVDQLQYVIDLIKNNPDSRRIMLNSWNPAEIKDMALPPCHVQMQFYVSADKKLSCQLYQRSADVFLGVPFNIVSYALLTHILADMCNLKVGDFIHTLGDTHIYLNHIDQIKTQLQREPYPLCTLTIKNHHDRIEDYQFNDFEFNDYQHHSTLKGAIAV